MLTSTPTYCLQVQEGFPNLLFKKTSLSSPGPLCSPPGSSQALKRRLKLSLKNNPLFPKTLLHPCSSLHQGTALQKPTRKSKCHPPCPTRDPSGARGATPALPRARRTPGEGRGEEETETSHLRGRSTRGIAPSGTAAVSGAAQDGAAPEVTEQRTDRRTSAYRPPSLRAPTAEPPRTDRNQRLSASRCRDTRCPHWPPSRTGLVAMAAASRSPRSRQPRPRPQQPRPAPPGPSRPGPALLLSPGAGKWSPRRARGRAGSSSPGGSAAPGGLSNRFWKPTRLMA